MNIAVLQRGLCIDAAVFDDLETAQEFLDMGVWPDADEVEELPDGYGIGDTYDGEWHKQKLPEPPEPETPQWTMEDELRYGVGINGLAILELNAAVNGEDTSGLVRMARAATTDDIISTMYDYDPISGIWSNLVWGGWAKISMVPADRLAEVNEILEKRGYKEA